jgi:hypothetical protein
VYVFDDVLHPYPYETLMAVHIDVAVYESIVYHDVDVHVLVDVRLI